MVTLRPNKRIYIQADADEQKSVLNVGPSDVFYGGSSVSSVSNDGSLAAGDVLTLTQGKWFVSAGANLMATVVDTTAQPSVFTYDDSETIAAGDWPSGTLIYQLDGDDNVIGLWVVA